MQPENIVTLTKAAGIEVEPYWPGLFAKLVEKKGVDEFIVNVGAGEHRRMHSSSRRRFLRGWLSGWLLSRMIACRPASCRYGGPLWWTAASQLAAATSMWAHGSAAL